jgi:hypothetical protein
MIKRPQSIVPEVLKALRRKFRVPDGMLNIAMPQVVLNGARIGVLVGQVKAAGVPQHMRMDRKGQGGGFARSADHVVDRTPHQDPRF